MALPGVGYPPCRKRSGRQPESVCWKLSWRMHRYGGGCVTWSGSSAWSLPRSVQGTTGSWRVVLVQKNPRRCYHCGKDPNGPGSLPITDAHTGQIQVRVDLEHQAPVQESRPPGVDHAGSSRALGTLPAVPVHQLQQPGAEGAGPPGPPAMPPSPTAHPGAVQSHPGNPATSLPPLPVAVMLVAVMLVAVMLVAVMSRALSVFSHGWVGGVVRETLGPRLVAPPSPTMPAVWLCRWFAW